MTLCSVGGAPGATTTALGLAMTWPGEALLIDADPSGAQPVPAGFFRGTQTLSGGLIELPQAVERGVLAAVIDRLAVPLPGSSARLLPGIESPRQMRALPSLWAPLAQVLSDMAHTGGQDVVVDAGRLGLVASPTPILARSDVTLLVLRSDLVSIAAAEAWLPLLRETCTGLLGLALVGAGRPYSAREVAARLGAPVLIQAAWDPRRAQVFSHGAEPGRRFAACSLARSLRAGHAALQAAVAVEGALQPEGTL